jgi:hypothetical protein
VDETRDGVWRHKKRPHEVAHRLFGEDTSPEAERFLLDAYRKMSGAEKIARVRALNQATIALALANIRQQHPDASEREVLLRLAVRRYGADFVREHLGWDAEKEGY